ncbi:MAG: imidazole glycerol phosphate synthase subunit HisF, partial [Flavobacteriaceae bacterium]|nr:imidazole glycerol phosphate synthase subunit HisF [Flavobacteriaceae bacterium]
NLRDAGDPVALAKQYAENGADELVFLDITATLESRSTTIDMVRNVAEQIDIPFTVGGGVSTKEGVELLLKSGADKVGVNSAAIKRPELINELSKAFGNQCIVVAIDAKQVEGKWLVHLAGGTMPTALDLFEWAKEVETRGAGEILFTSMNNDGVKTGFANAALAQLSKTVNIPIIASGGAGTTQHFVDVFTEGKADAALAASVFHFGEIAIHDLKQELQSNNINIRL